MNNTNTIANAVRNKSAPEIPAGETPVATLARVILDNYGRIVLDATQGDIPTKTKGATRQANGSYLGGVLKIPGALGLGGVQTGLATASGNSSQALALPISSLYGFSEFGGGSGATAGAVTIGSTIITAIAVATGGSGYAAGATVTITGGSGTGATATATVVAGVVTAIVVTAGGTGYSGTPTVTISPAGVVSGTDAGLYNGTGASATAVLTTQTLTGFTSLVGGSGYTNGATVTITGGSGTGATATATVANGVITALNVTAAGSGYSGTPSVVITPNTFTTGSGAIYAVTNLGANPLTVYGGYNDTFDGGAANGSVTIPVGATRLFIDTAVNVWTTILSGVPPIQLKTLNSQAGTTYTLALTDNGLVIPITNASGITVTLPNSFPPGFECTVIQGGAGQITFSAASGGSLVGARATVPASTSSGTPVTYGTGATKTGCEYAAVTLRVLSNTGAAAVWNLTGQTV